MRGTAATRVGRLPEVLDAVAAQTRPPERLVVVAADDADASGASASGRPAPPDGASVLARVTALVEAHEGLVAAVPEVVVIGLPAPADLGAAVDAALAELDRRSAPGESVPDASAPPAVRPAESPHASGGPERNEAHESNGAHESIEAHESNEAPAPAGAEPPEAESAAGESPGVESAEAEPAAAGAADRDAAATSTHRREPESDPALSSPEPPAVPTRSSAPDTPTGPEWLWILEDTVAPQPTALRRLVEAVRRSPSVGIAGPKVVRWENPRLLVELGRQVTRAGRRVDSPAFGEADQGQYDTRTDVLAVGTAGMLVRRSVYTELDGFEPAFAAAGADLDLGWRAQLAGHRVVVVPSAVVRRTRSAAERQAGLLATRLTERRAARRVALTRCSPLAVPFLALWTLVGGVLSALALLLLKRPQHAWAELSDIGALGRPFSSTAARWRFRRATTVRRRHLTGLFIGSGAALGASWDRVQDAVTPDRRATEQTPTGDAAAAESGPVAEEAESLSGLPPSLPQRIATHPGFLAVLACTILSALTFRTALTQGVLDARGPGFAGGELFGVATNSDGLWHLYRDAWHGAGFGNALDTSPSMGVLAGLTWLVQWVPYVDDGRTPAGVTLSWLILAAMPLSALTAYLAARVATRARWGRGLVALAWGTSGVLTAALTQGRVSVVVAHLLLPLVVAGFAAAMKRDGTWTATFAAALAAGLLGAFVPVLLAIGVVAALVAVVVAPGLGRRLRAAVLAVVPIALLGPWVLQFVDEPRLLLTGQGLLDVGPDSPPAWQLALAQPDGGTQLVGLLFVPVLVLAVAALARRSGGRPRSVALTALTGTALVGLAVAYLSERVEVGQAVGADGQPTLATLWAGIGLELYVVAVLGILLVGWHGLAHVLGEQRFGWRRFVAAALAAVLAGGLAVAAGLTAWAGAGALQLGSETFPAVAVEQANAPDANRLVVLTPSADRLDFAVIGNEPGELMRDVQRPADVTDPGLATLLGTIASGGVLPGGAGDALADLGVGFVSVVATADDPLTRTLDAASGLTRLGSTADQTLWRVVARPSAAAADVAVPPSRVRLDSSEGRPLQMVAVDGPHGAVEQDLSVAAAGRQVVFAEAPEWASHAVVTYNGQVLSPVAETGTPTYLVPPAAGRLEADLPPSHPRWFLAQLALLAAVVFLAIPFGSRRSRRLV
jgi:GT2 family glycosyltransferase